MNTPNPPSVSHCCTVITRNVHVECDECFLLIWILLAQFVSWMNSHFTDETALQKIHNMYCTVLYCTVLHCTALHCTVLCCAALRCAVLRCAALYSTVLCYAVLRCAALCCAALHCAVLHCTALRCTVPTDPLIATAAYRDMCATVHCVQDIHLVLSDTDTSVKVQQKGTRWGGGGGGVGWCRGGISPSNFENFCSCSEKPPTKLHGSCVEFIYLHHFVF